MKIVTVNPREIQRNPQPVRTSRDSGEFDKLVSSVKAMRRLVVPPTVYRSGGVLSAKLGSRRIDAAIKAGLKEIQVIVSDGEENSLIDQVIENQVREGLSHYDEKHAIWDILEDRGLTEHKNQEAIDLISGIFGLAKSTSEGKIRAARDLFGPTETPEEKEEQEELALATQATVNTPDRPGDQTEATERQMANSAIDRIQREIDDKHNAALLIIRGNTQRFSKWQAIDVIRTYNLARRDKEFGQEGNRRAIANLLRKDRKFSAEVDTIEGYNAAYHKPKPVPENKSHLEIPEVKDTLERFAAIRRLLSETMVAVNKKKWSPEAVRFFAKKVRDFGQELINWADALEEKWG